MVDTALDQSLDHRAATVAARRHFPSPASSSMGCWLSSRRSTWSVAESVVLNSFRDQQEIARNGLISLPRSFRLEAWGQAWSTYCIGGNLRGACSATSTTL